MRARGINYDTGIFPGGDFTRPVFTTQAVRRDLAVIADELHCDAVRLSGREPERLSIAARHAADAGLEVWFGPFPVDVDPAGTLELFTDCARRAEAVRSGGAEVVLVTGCELTAFCSGFLPGETYRDRIRAMATADASWWAALEPAVQRLNAFLIEAVTAVRTHFGGRVTYASGPWEMVDWSLFDLIGIDAYRTAENAADFRTHLREIVGQGKPVAITEYGTCAYRGAGDRGGMAWQAPADAVPDEDEQVRYFTELHGIFDQDGVDTSLWFTFAGFDKPAEADLTSYGVVRMLDEIRWEPKKVFHAMAGTYRRDGRARG